MYVYTYIHIYIYFFFSYQEDVKSQDSLLSVYLGAEARSVGTTFLQEKYWQLAEEMAKCRSQNNKIRMYVQILLGIEPSNLSYTLVSLQEKWR